MVKLLQALALLLVALCPFAPAHAAWVEASSAHFVVYGDMSEQQARTYTARLERFDSALRAMVGEGTKEVSAPRVTIYFVGGTEEVRRYCTGCPIGVAGFYNARAEGTFAMVPRSTGGDGGVGALKAMSILLHEYTHHILLSNDERALPMWINEGMAEFFMTALEKPDGSLQIGVPDMARGYTLEHGSQESVQDLLTADARTLSGEERGKVYAWGWGLVHYLLLGKARQGQLERYLTLLAGGTPSLAAGRQAFGNLDTLDHELHNHLKRRTLPFVALPADMLKVGEIAVRPLRPGEAAAMPTHMRSDVGVTEKTAPLVLLDARRVASAYPDDPWVQRVDAEAEYDAKHDAEAEAAVDRALARDPRMVDALLYKGRVHVRRAATAKSGEAAVWREARSWYLQAYKLDPDNAGALMLYYDSFAAAKETPTRGAVDALLRATVLVPRDTGLRTRVFMQMLADDDLKAARAALAPVAFNPHAGAKNPAKDLLVLMDGGADAKTVRAAAVKAKLGATADD